MPRLKKLKLITYFFLATVIYIGYKSLFKYSPFLCYISKDISSLVNPIKNYYDLGPHLCSKNKSFCVEKIPRVDIQMLDAYNQIDFKHKISPEWEEGWCVKPDPNAWNNEKKLHVFVVPHSHNDPGWLRTFDEYYHYATKHILYNMLHKLKENKEMRFIWAEMSFFSRWFNELTESQKRSVKVFLKNKQLEIVTGGWVMPDEANSHWYSLLIQLQEGQAWLHKNLNYTPISAWAIDPFGHSPTMTNLLKMTGFKHMVVGRTHYIVKKHFAMYKHLEFNWNQLWDASQNSSIFTHMLPFSSYAIHYSHGPNKAICKLFDFRKTDKFYWPWEDRPTQITYETVRQRADVLVNEWKKKASLYKTNAILVPHGDDFRYVTSEEWEDQRINLNRLFRFINNVGNYHIEVKFATLQDYFDFVGTKKQEIHFPSLSGDFFTYSDEKQDYWSGYYTTRPYYKRMDRTLLHFLKASEMLIVLRGQFESLNELESVRRVHSLFQHHDGVTGTARQRVMEDYGKQMEWALEKCYRIIKGDSAGYVFTKDKLLGTGTFKYSLFNSLLFNRTEIVELYSWTPYVTVYDSNNLPIVTQITPVFNWEKQHRGIYTPTLGSIKKYRVSLKVHVPSLSVTNFNINVFGSNSTDYTYKYAKLSNLTVFGSNRYFELRKTNSAFKTQFEETRTFHATHDSIQYHFKENGLLSHVIFNDGTRYQISIKFLKYLTHGPFQDKSGAYLFRPRGKASPLYDTRNIIIVSQGVHETCISAGFEFGVHEILIRNSEIEVYNTIDIGKRDNTEIVMRVSTTIDSMNEFYTDLNGYQLLKRERLSKIPLQANYYPISSIIYIQDKENRFSILTGQPLGGSSLKSGQMEIMQDRRLTESDGRGLGEGVMDNRPIRNTFKFVLERQSEIGSRVHEKHPSGFHSILTHQQGQRLLFPLIQGIDLKLEVPIAKEFVETSGLEVVLLKQLNSADIGIVLHKMYLEGESEDFVLEIDLKQHLRIKSGNLFISTVMLLSEQEPEITNYRVSFRQMETKAFIIKNIKLMR